MSYRDSKTGRFVSEATWKRSKAKGGKRYRRVQVPRKNVDHIVTIKITTRERRPNGTWRTREFARDIIIPAPPKTTKKELFKIAEKTLPKKERYVIEWHKQRGRKLIVAEGPKTRARKARLR